MLYKSDCRYFKGFIPCRPHKIFGYHCSDCPSYEPTKEKILIIKLGAIGDVIRTTPLIHKIRQLYPLSTIWWLTYTPDILPSAVDRRFDMSLESILTIQAVEFDILINLDKDLYACGLASTIKAIEKLGFVLSGGMPAPADSRADAKFLTGLFDDVSKANTKSYVEEIFEICGWSFSGEEYMLDCNKSIEWNIPAAGKPIIGLNTGCGERWRSRLWDEQNWKKLIEMINGAGLFPLLLGGKQEHEKNRRLADSTGSLYLGYYPLPDFVSLVAECNVVVTAVTMALHIAIGTGKQHVLINNIFNPREFELYGRGEIVQPEKPCLCFFSPACKNPDYFCMDSLSPAVVCDAVLRRVAALRVVL